MKKHMLVITPCILLLLFTEWWYMDSTSEPKHLYHVLLFKWKAAVGEAQFSEVNHLWRNLTEEIEGFDSYELHPLASGDFDHMLILRFSSQEAYQTYRDHEDHQRIGELGPRLVDEFSAFSYWR